VGKSDAVFSLADYILSHSLAKGVVIISADSRQVYKGLEVLTGADLPPDFIAGNNHFSKATQQGTIELYGIAMISVSDEWSLGNFLEYVRPIIKQAQADNKQILVVGGTGLYHEHLLNEDSRLSIPPNLELRTQLAQLTVEELQAKLQELSPLRFEQMNNSDKNNPRRLQRAIEVALYSQEIYENETANQETAANEDHRYLGLLLPLEIVYEKIKERVKIRFENGAVEEVKNILSHTKVLSPQLTTTLGFTEIQRFLAGELSAQQCQELWAQADFSYSKRQLTWWKKYGPVQWFEKEDPNWYKNFLASATQSLT
jgi:tRNA dimethylallyltransferase